VANVQLGCLRHANHSNVVVVAVADVQLYGLSNGNRCTDLDVLPRSAEFFVLVAVGDREVRVVEYCTGLVVVVTGSDVQSCWLASNGYCCLYFFFGSPLAMV
jgi:hypothetical protein